MQCLVILLAFVSGNEFVNSLKLESLCLRGRPCLPTSSNSSETPKNRSEAMETTTWRPEFHKNRTWNFNKQLRGADGLDANHFSNLPSKNDAEKKFRIRLRIEVAFRNATHFLFAPKPKYERILDSAYKRDGIFVRNNEPTIGVEENGNGSDIGKVSISENISIAEKLNQINSSSEVLRSNYISEISFQKSTAGGLVKSEVFLKPELFTESYDITKFSEGSNVVKVNESSIPYIATAAPITLNYHGNNVDSRQAPNSKQGGFPRLLINESKSHLNNMLTDFRNEIKNTRSRRFVELSSQLNQSSCITKECEYSSKSSTGLERSLLFKINSYNETLALTSQNITSNIKSFPASKKLYSDNTAVLPNGRKAHHRRNPILKPNKPFTYAEYSAKKTKLYPIESHPQFKEDLKSRPISDNSGMVVDRVSGSYQTGTIAGDEVTDSLLGRNDGGMSLEDDFASSDEPRKKSELQIDEESLDKESGALKMETGSGDQLGEGGIREKKEQNGKQYIDRRLNDLFGGGRNLQGSANRKESLEIGKSLKKNGEKFLQLNYFAPMEQSTVLPMALGARQDLNIQEGELFTSHIHGSLQNIHNLSATGIKLGDTSPTESDDMTSTKMKEWQTLEKKENYPYKLDQYNESKIIGDRLARFQQRHFDNNRLEVTEKNSNAIAPIYNSAGSLSSIALNTLSSRIKRQLVKIPQNENNVKNRDNESLNQNRRWDNALVLVIDKSALPIAFRTQNTEYTHSHDNTGYNSEIRAQVPRSYQHATSKGITEVVTSDTLEYRDKPRYVSGYSISNLGESQTTTSRQRNPTSNASTNVRQSVDNGGRWKKVGITAVVERNRAQLTKFNDPRESAHTQTNISFVRPKSRLKSWFETKVLNGNLKSLKTLPNSNGNSPSEIWYIILPIEKREASPDNDTNKEASISGSKRASLQPKYDELEKRPIARQRELESEDTDDATRVGTSGTTYRAPTYIYPKNKFIYPMSRGVKRNKPNLQQFERYVGEDQLEATNDTDQRGFLDWFNTQWGFVTPTASTFDEKSTKDSNGVTTNIPPNNQFTTTHTDVQLTVRNTNYQPTTNFPNTQPMEDRRNQHTTYYTEEQHATTKAFNTDEIFKKNATKQPDILQSTNVPESIQSRKARPTKIPGNKLTTKSPKRSSTTKSTTRKPYRKTTMKPITTEKPENIVNKPVTHDPWWNDPHDPWWNRLNDPWWNKPPDPWWHRPNDPWWNGHAKKPGKKPKPCSKGFVPNNPWKIWKRPMMNNHGMKGGD